MRDPELTKRAKQMRREPTETELRLWTVLRAKRFGAIKFRYQKVIGSFIADFSARQPMVVIEVDGDTHALSKGYDAARTRNLEMLGYRVIRFTNRDVIEKLEGVTIELDRFVHTPPLPTSVGSAMPPAWPKQHGVLFTRHSPEGERAS